MALAFAFVSAFDQAVIIFKTDRIDLAFFDRLSNGTTWITTVFAIAEFAGAEYALKLTVAKAQIRESLVSQSNSRQEADDISVKQWWCVAPSLKHH